MPKRPEFESSRELKTLFNEQFESWKRRHRLGLQELAERCGVSSAYLAHIGRYGRVPGKPVLILLAFNFEMPSPAVLFEAAGMKDPWPYEPELGLNRTEKAASSLLSVKFDMDGFTEVIRGVIRSENRQRSLRDLVGKRPLRIGMNPTQGWMYDSVEEGGSRGFFPEFCEMLGVSLQREVETVRTPFGEYVQKLSSGELDMFGPIMAAPNSPTEILFTIPLYRLGLSAIMRKRRTVDLESLSAPNSFNDFRDRKYEIAVLRYSLAHLIANTRLNRPDSTLIFCESDEEALDRILLRGIQRPAHLFLCNSIMARRSAKLHPRDVLPLFNTRETLLDLAENSIAVRPDWPEALPMLNDAIRFLFNRGGLREQLNDLIAPEYRDLIEL